MDVFRHTNNTIGGGRVQSEGDPLSALCVNEKQAECYAEMYSIKHGQC